MDGPDGAFAAYVVHMPSGSGFDVEQRDRAAARLGAEIAAEPLERVVLMGDLNGSTDDRGPALLTSRLTSVQEAGGPGFGLTWPSGFPVARIDHVLTRGIAPTEAWSLPETGSDHLLVAARLRL